MKRIYILLTGLLIGFSLNAQDAVQNIHSAVFHRYLPVPGSMGILYRSVQTTDGGYASVGHITDLSSFTDDFLILKTNADGTTGWSKRLASSEYDEFHDLIETNDNGLAVAGSVMNSATFISQAVVVKFDGNGVKQWSKTYSLNGISSTANWIQKDGSGFLYVLGSVDVTGASTDYLLMKIDPSNGDLLEQHTFGTPESDLPLAFLRKSTGDFFISGAHDITGSGENIHLLKINSSMAVDWNKLSSGSDNYFCYDMREKLNGNLVFAGRYTTFEEPYDILLGEIETLTGNPVWANHYTPAGGLPCYALGLTVNTGDVFGLTGAVEDTSGGTFILTTASDGTLNWSEKLGGGSGVYNSGYGIMKTNDGGYFVCGSWSGTNNSTVQVLKTTAVRDIPCNKLPFDVVTTALTLPEQSLTISAGTSTLSAQDFVPEELTLDPLEDICQGLGITENKIMDDVIVYPNPSKGQFTVSTKGLEKSASLSITDPLGKVIYYNNDPGAKIEETSINIDLNLSPGIYLVRLINNNSVATKQLIVN